MGKGKALLIGALVAVLFGLSGCGCKGCRAPAPEKELKDNVISPL